MLIRSRGMATFRKSKSGEWEVFGPASEVKPGAVSVRKADGSTKTVAVASVSKSFDVNGVPHVYGRLASEPRSTVQHPLERRSSEVCCECGRPGATIRCYDSSGCSGLCCARCARMSRYERSFG